LTEPAPPPSSQPGPRLELNRPRDLNALLTDSFSLYRRHFWTLLAVAFVVVVPVHAVVLGVGLGQFSGGYDSTPAPASTLVPGLTWLLVVIPLMSVMMLDALLAMAEGRKPGFASTVQAGLDAFGRVFWPVLIAVLCMAGTIITVVIPVLLLVRWFFVPQLVVLDGARGTAALRASWELTRGFAWRVAGLVFVVQILFNLAGALAATPLAALGRSLDSEAVSLGATTLAEVLVAPPVGIFAALLYYDLRSRKAALAR
jgi:hypothetical protein